MAHVSLGQRPMANESCDVTWNPPYGYAFHCLEPTVHLSPWPGARHGTSQSDIPLSSAGFNDTHQIRVVFLDARPARSTLHDTIWRASDGLHITSSVSSQRKTGLMSPATSSLSPSNYSTTTTRPMSLQNILTNDESFIALPKVTCSDG